jgi:hypothetical protein
MDWTPTIIDPDEHARIVAVIGEIIAGLAQVESRSDLLDRALLRAYTADLLGDADEDASLTRALDLEDAGASRLGLFGGLVQVGWTVAHLAGGDDADQLTAAIDERLANVLERPWTAEYDLVHGLVGFGVYALERGESGRALAVRVLDELDALARPRGAGIAWHTRSELMAPHERAGAPGGCWDLGVAHGAAGVIALLARYVATGIEPARARASLERAVAFLLAAEPSDRDGRYPTWYVDGPGEQPAPSTRLAWCYGDLGIALALVSAARACDRDDWQAEALALARRCAMRAQDHAYVIDSGLCHGSAGAAHQFHRLYQATRDPIFVDASRAWLDRLLATRRSEPIAGFPAATFSDRATFTWSPDPSLLVGACGVALALAAFVSDLEPRWDRMLLLDL